MTVCNSMWTNEEVEILRREYGTTPARDLKIGDHTAEQIRCKAKRLKIKSDRLKMAAICNSRDRRFDVNDDFFHIPNILNCYYAGFIAADGCVHAIRPLLQINIHKKDQIILENFSDDTNFAGTYHVYGDKAKLHITSAQWRRDLFNNFSITPRKSLTLQPPKLFDEELIQAFIIGLIDGDGCIDFNRHGKLRISLSGTYDICQWVKQYCDNSDNQCYNKKLSNVLPGHGNVWRYEISGERAVRILNILKQLPVPKLVRKWDRV